MQYIKNSHKKTKTLSCIEAGDFWCEGLLK